MLFRFLPSSGLQSWVLLRASRSHDPLWDQVDMLLPPLPISLEVSCALATVLHPASLTDKLPSSQPRQDVDDHR